MHMLPCPHTGSLGTLHDLAVYLLGTDDGHISLVGLYRLIQQIEDSLGTSLCHNDTVQLLTDLADGHVEALVKG